MSNAAAEQIICAEARTACRGIADVNERIRAAMKSAKNAWISTDPNSQFKAAIAAAYLETEKGSAEQELIAKSSRAVAMVNAALNALRAGVPVALEEMEPPDADVIPLMKLWNEVE